MVVPGAMAISIYTDIQNPDMVFPTIVLRALPVGLVGLVLAGLISAIMSTVDSTLNSASTLIVIDFIKPKKPEITPKEVAKYGRITTFILMFVAAAWAPMIVNFGGIWIYLQQMFTIFVPPIVVLFLLGVFYKRGNAEGAFWTLVIGVSMGILLFGLEQYGYWPIHFTINAGIVVAVSSIVFVVVSIMTDPPPQEKITNLTYRKGLINAGNENMPWYKNYKYYAYLLLVCIGIIFAILF